jgi:hypothetical protein
MGAHPAAPSRLCQPNGSEVSLAAAIRADPVAVLGRECTARFGPGLPFLLVSASAGAGDVPASRGSARLSSRGRGSHNQPVPSRSNDASATSRNA